MADYPIPVQYDPITGEDLSNFPRATVMPKNTFDERFPIPVETPIEDRTSAGYLDALLGAGGQERFQLWPERMVRSALSAAGEAVEGKLPVDRDPITGKYFSEIDYEPNWIAKNIFGSGNFRGPAEGSIIERAQDVTGMAGMSTLPGVAAAGGIAKNTLGIVPVAKAKELKVTPIPASDILKSAVENTPGATFDPDGALRINIKRGQLPEQEMAESVRGSVFYLPEGDKNFRYYKGTSGNNYGGSQLIEGETAYLNPLVVKGATGGKAPETAYTQLMGKEAFKQLEADVRQAAYGPNNVRGNNLQLELTQRFLEKYAPDLVNHAEYIIENSKKGNQLRYALKEAAISSAVRNAGHDGIIGYSVGRGEKAGKPFISEILDVRENRYPSPSGDYSVHPQFLEDSRAGTGIAALNQQGMYSTLERVLANSKVEKATPEQWQAYLKNQPGIKPEELEFSLAGLPQKQLTKAEVQQHINENGIKLGEVWKGKENLSPKEKLKLEGYQKIVGRKRLSNEEELEFEALSQKANDTYKSEPKFSSYQLPGGENYRELLLTVPSQSKDKFIKEYQNKTGVDISKYTNEQINNLRQKAKGIVSDTQYKSSHWDEPNVLAHIRMNDRVIGTKNISDIEAKLQAAYPDTLIKNMGSGMPKKAVAEKVLTSEEAADLSRAKDWLSGYEDKSGTGLKTLHIEEIQSDWHQAGRKGGYDIAQKPENYIIEGNGPWVIRNKENGDFVHDFNKKQHAEGYLKDIQEGKILPWKRKGLVPNAPFKKTWDELALKRTLTEAVNNGYDAVSWTPGEAQAARYDLNKHYDNINIVKRHDGTYNVFGKQRGERDTNPIQDNVPENKLSDIVGKELAEKAVKGQEEFKGADLKIGGEGMKAFYDTMLVAKANALVKKMGGKVEYEKIPDSFRIDEFGNPAFGGRYRVFKDKEMIDNFPTKKAAQEYINKNATKIPIIKITPQMREKIQKEGFPLYSSGVPTFSEVNNIPEKKQPKLVPVPYIPGQVI